MSATEVDALVRSVIVHFGLPFSVLSVAASATGWDINVRAGSGRILSFALYGGRPVAMRVAIQEKLEAHV
jgi:hypothetical protein